MYKFQNKSPDPIDMVEVTNEPGANGELRFRHKDKL